MKSIVIKKCSGAMLILMSLPLLSSCAGMIASMGVDPTNYEAVQQGVTRSYDAYRKSESYNGPFISTGNLYDSSMFRIASSKSDSGMQFSIVIAESYSDDNWRYYRSIVDSNSNRLQVGVSEREVDSCNVTAYSSSCRYSEYLAVEVDAYYLRNHQKTGLAFRLYSDSGVTKDLFMPGTYISGVLDAIPYAP